jgi:hypothetical protein
VMIPKIAAPVITGSWSLLFSAHTPKSTTHNAISRPTAKVFVFDKN